jgi:hypothetical protein
MRANQGGATFYLYLEGVQRRTGGSDGGAAKRSGNRKGGGGREGGRGGRSNRGGEQTDAGQAKSQACGEYRRGRQGCLEYTKRETLKLAVASGGGVGDGASIILSPCVLLLRMPIQDRHTKLKLRHTWTPDDDAARAKAKTEARRSMVMTGGACVCGVGWIEVGGGVRSLLFLGDDRDRLSRWMDQASNAQTKRPKDKHNATLASKHH